MGDLGLGFDNILGDDEVMSLFGDNSQEEETKQEPEDNESSEKDNSEEENTAEVVNTGSYFGEEDEDEDDKQPESVGSGEKNNKEQKEDTASEQDSGTSPDFFSSIATACVEEGIFPDLDEDTIKSIKSAADLKEAFDKQIEAGLTEQQLRIKKALDNGVEDSKIRQYETLLNYLDNLDDTISQEGDDADEARKRVIFQDYINKGFSKERAEKAVNKAFEDGTDKEEAEEALKSCKDFYKTGYKSLLDEAKKEADNQVREREQKALRIKKALIDDDIKFLGDMEITKTMRQKAYDAISKPVYKDSETGELMTALQKLEHDNGEEFMVKLGIMYVLTDGFKNVDSLINNKVKKEMKKGFSDLERKIKMPSRPIGGDLSYVDNDGRVFLDKGIQLDI